MASQKFSFGLVLCIVLVAGSAQALTFPDDVSSFPEDFVWGVASAAYQVEGAYQADDKGPSIWDVFSHIPNVTHNNENGDIADDFYHKYAEDAQLMKSLGVKHFRFSFSWPRIVPNGTIINGTIGVSQLGVAFYSKVLQALTDNDIEPWVTLYHWDLPAALNDQTSTGGWLNPNISDIFNDYADFCFKTFGGSVKKWLTVNEISSFAWIGYGNGEHAPGRCSSDVIEKCNSVGGQGNSSTEPYIVAHHAILAHAKAVQTYNQKYKGAQNGTIGFTFNAGWALPWNPNNPDDIAAVESNVIFNYAWYVDPIVKGDYPDLMKEYVGARLPNFTDADKALLTSNSSQVDFLGLNHYTSKFVQSTGVQGTSFLTDGRYNELNVDAFGNLIGEASSSEWLYVYPTGLRMLLRWIEERYDMPVYIFENGVSCPGESNGTWPDVLNDTFRVNYLQHYIANMVYAIMEDSVDVRGYFTWSITDNFEWAYGYDIRFGLVHINYTDSDRTRANKTSATWYSNAITNIEGGQNLTTVLGYLGLEETTVDTISI